jgi:CRISPR-associated protein Cst2
MTYLAGKIVITVNAGAPNNGRGEATTARVKKAVIRGRVYPYVSAQAARRWIRDTMADHGSQPSPTERVGRAQGKAQKAVTAADPALYPDDDLFGYFHAAVREGNASTTLRDSPFMLGTFLAVEPVRLTEDFGVMARGVDDPVLHAHEFYTADLAAPFLLDLPSVGTFTVPGKDSLTPGRPNYLSEQAALRATPGLAHVTLRGHAALQLPIGERRDRAAVFLEALADLAGGAKKALHYEDRTPALIALVPVAGGINPLGFVVGGAEDGSGLQVRPRVLRDELTAWDGEWEAPVRFGWRPGFREDAAKQFASDVADLEEAGQVTIAHPRVMLRTLAEEIRNGSHDSWFSDGAPNG